MRTKDTRKAGFTLTELLVLIGVGSVLAGLLVADLTQTRTKFLQQACAGNLKHWGMAIDLYSQDYSGTYYYSFNAAAFDDSAGNPYLQYIGGTNAITTIRNVRICPATAASMTSSQVNISAIHSYSMAKPQAVYGGAPFYRNIDASVSSPFVSDGGLSIWPTLRYLRNPSQYLLLIDSDGHTLTCGGLAGRVTSIPSSGPAISAIDRHGGVVNCLFGDQHVELVSSQAISNQNAIACGALTNQTENPWFMMN